MKTGRKLLTAMIIIAALSVFAVVAVHDGATTEAAATGDYTVDGGNLSAAHFTDLSAAVGAIESDGSAGAIYTITVNADDPTASAVTINAGKHVILTSADPANPCILTSTTANVRQIIVTGTGTMLTIKDLILDGNTTGGGIGVEAAGSLNINAGTIIQHCHGINGGGIQVNGNNSNLSINGGEIINNFATTNGGGIYAQNDASITVSISGATISGNTKSGSAGNGGGIDIEGTATITDCNISDNIVETTGSSTGGGGIYLNKGSIIDSVISGNKCGSNGLYGGGILINNYPSNITGCQIKNNSAAYGGGIGTIKSSQVTITDCVIETNKASTVGGGIYQSGIKTTIIGSTISNNSISSTGTSPGSIGSGAGIFLESVGVTCDISSTEISNNHGSLGGGIFAHSSTTLTIHDNVLINGNTAKYGGGIYINSATSKVSISGCTISNNIANGPETVKGSGGGIFTNNFSYPTVSDGVIFYGNSAPTLRTQDISATADIDGNSVYDITDYSNKIGSVVLDSFVDIGQNAPAYNNFDINYAGDSFLVSFDSNGGSSIDHQQIASDGSSQANIPSDPIYDGYDFTGWFSDSDLTSEFNFETPITSNTTLFAGWMETEDGGDGGDGNGNGNGNGEYTVTYDINLSGPDTTSIPPQTVTSGGSVILEDPQDHDIFILGGWFDGWKADNAGPLLLAGSTYTPSSDVTLIGQWSNAPPPGPPDKSGHHSLLWIFFIVLIIAVFIAVIWTIMRD